MTETKTVFGCLTYSTSMNLGDEIQSIAAINQIEKLGYHISYYIDRDTSDIIPIDPQGENGSEKITCIYNCWADGAYCKWPPADRIVPIFISFHINEVSKDKTYTSLDKYLLNNPSSLADLKFNDYYKQFSPIYTRDIHTEKLLTQVDAKFLGCLTMTLESSYSDERTGTFLVDIDPKMYEYIPADLRKDSKRLTHISHTKDPTSKLEEARTLLETYKRAKLVITSRLHCALPCLAFRTPVIFMLSGWQTDPRFEGLSNLLTIFGRDEINWNNHTNKDNTVLASMVAQLNEKISELLLAQIN